MCFTPETNVVNLIIVSQRFPPLPPFLLFKIKLIKYNQMIAYFAKDINIIGFGRVFLDVINDHQLI